MPIVEEPAKVDVPEWLSAAQVASMAGRDIRVIRKLAGDGVLPAHRPGRCRPMFKRADVERFLATGKASAN